MVAVATAPVKTGPASSSTECLIPHRLGSRWTTSWTDPAGFEARDDKESVSVRMWGRGKKPKTNPKAALDNSSDEDNRRWTSPATAPLSERRHSFGDTQSPPKKKRYSFMPARLAPAPPPEAPGAESAEAAHASALAKLTGSPSTVAASHGETKKRRFSLKSLPARPPTPEPLPPPPLLSLKDVKGGMSFASDSGKRGWGEYDEFGAVNHTKPNTQDGDGDVTPPKANPFDGGFTPVSPNLGEERRAKRLSRHATGERTLPPRLPAPADMIAANPDLGLANDQRVANPGLANDQRVARHRSAPVGRPVTRTLRRKPPPKADEELLQNESGHGTQTTPPSAPATVARASSTAAPASRGAASTAIPNAVAVHASTNGPAVPAVAVAGAAAAATFGAAAFAIKPAANTNTNTPPAAVGAAAFRSEPVPAPPGAVDTPRDVDAVSTSPEAPAATLTATPVSATSAAPEAPVATLTATQISATVTPRDASLTAESIPVAVAAAPAALPTPEAQHESVAAHTERVISPESPTPQSAATQAGSTQAHVRQSSVSTAESMHTAHSDSSAAVTAPTSPIDATFAPPSTGHTPQPPTSSGWPIFPVVPVTSMPPRSTPASPTLPTEDDVATPRAQADTLTPRAIPHALAVQDSTLVPQPSTEIAPAPTTVAAHMALASAVDTPPRKVLAISPPRRRPIPAAWQSQQSLLVPEEERPSSTTPPATAESGIFPQHRDEFVDAPGPEGFAAPTATHVAAVRVATVAAGVATVGAVAAHSKTSSMSSTSTDRIRPSDIAQIPPFSPPRRAVAPMPSEYAYDRPATHARAAESLRARHGLSPEPPEEARHLRVSAYGVPELDFTRTPPPEREHDDEPAETEAHGRSSSEREVLQTPALGEAALSMSSHSGYAQSQYIQPPWPRSRGHSRASSTSRSTTSAASAAPPSVSAFTDRLPRSGHDDGDGDGVEGLLSAQHTGTTKGRESDTPTVESSPRAPSWIDYARPPKVLELEAAVAAAAAASTKPFPNPDQRLFQQDKEMEVARDLDASTTRESPDRATRESRRHGLVSMDGRATNSNANGHGSGREPSLSLQPVFHAPPPPLHSPSAPVPPPKDHFGTYPSGHTYATGGPSVDAASHHDSVGRSPRPQTADTPDTAPRPFGSLGRSSRPNTSGGIASSHPFNSLRSTMPTTQDPVVHSSQAGAGTDAARTTSTDRVTPPTHRATSPFNAAQWAKLQPINSAHASALSRLEGTSAETYSLAHEAHPHPPPPFPGPRATSPEPRKRFSFRSTGGSLREKKKKRFSLLPESKTALDISAPVPASEVPLAADAWPAGGVGSRLSGIVQTPLPPTPAVSSMSVGTPAKLSVHPDTSRHHHNAPDIPERPTSAASRRSRRWSFKPSKKARGPDVDAPPVPALPPVLPLPSSFEEAKDMSLSESPLKAATQRPIPVQHQVEVDESKRKKGGKFMRTLRGLFKH
ncbi:hypothetical protein CcaverHIS002_0312420 [Cutaneotrichosporon cavernicola]|nr:hypothetical protein CcaverHIS002_0312420 [Cutaneotrichosporon cavernicola]